MHSDQTSARLKRRLQMTPIAIMGAGLLVLVFVIMLVLSYETSTRFRQIKQGWQDYSEAADPRGIWISEIRGYFGYGGMIHNFKNYVLRNDEKYAQTLRVQTSYLLDTIDSYQNADPDIIEQDALKRIRSVVNEYSNNIDKITLGIAQNLTPEKIDAIVQVNDTDALQALGLLESHWRDKRQRNLSDIVNALSNGDVLVRSLAGVMVLLAALVGCLALLFHTLIGNTLRSNAAQIKELEARKHAQEEERKLAWVVQQSPASILITDIHGKIEFVNRKILEITGYSEQDLIGKSPNILKSGHTSEAAYLDIWKGLRDGHPWSGIFKNLRKDGSHYWASTQILPLLDEDGEITNYIGVAEDITEKRRVDGHIAQIQKMEAVGILAGSVAHDFNNVLMTIIGNTELIKLDAEDWNAPDDVMTSVSQIELASRRARALIQQLLTFARQQPGQAQRLDLQSAIEQALELIAVSTPPTIQVALHAKDQVAAIDIDPTAFFQIVMNLCHNAIEAIGDRGGTINLSIDSIDSNGPDGLSALPEDAIGTIRIRISDDGPGIPMDIQQKVFEPFFSTKPVGKGTGLGLAIVRKWIEEAHGRVTLESTRAEGSTFTLLFPQYAAHTAKTKARLKPLRGHEHILLVDDEETLLYTIRQMMARLGYRVEAFSNPALALHAFRTNPESYDLVVTDMMMPEMTGDELIVHLREIRADLPAMIISSYHTKTNFPAGFENVQKVSKPINMTDLSIALRKTIEGD